MHGHSHDIPDTPEVRAKIDEAQTAALSALGIDARKVAVWEDGFRSVDELDRSFEWWYFDMHLDDGSTLVATYNSKPNTAPDGPLDPSVLIIYHGADGTKIRSDVRHPADTFSAKRDNCDVTVGPNTVRGDLEHYELHLDDAGVVADLRLDRASPSWRPGAGLTYFDSAHKDYFGWVVPVPYGKVSGTITVDGETREVTGSGYHDHNWGNKVMDAGLDHWFWGRAHIGDYTVVYVKMTTKGLFGLGSINIPTFLLAKGDEVITDDMVPLRLETSGEVDGPGHQSYPTELRWIWRTDEGSVEMHVTNVEMIEALDMSSEHKGPLHGLRALFEHPQYYDFNADMTLSIDLGGINETVTGRTLFEKMMFR
ncbi:MAG: lipocalin-like domain-containing protein [Microthrixaceae bacterium]